MTPLLDDNRRRAHKLPQRAALRILLVAGLGLVTTFSVWLLWSWMGVR